MHLKTAAIAALALAAPPAVAHDEAGPAYDKLTRGTTVIGWEGSGVEIKILLEAGNLGGPEFEVGEIVFAPGYEGAPHVHGSVEVFYPLEGDFEHWVEGEWHDVVDGTIAAVRPGDQVIHRCASDIPCKLLVIWGPGGEIDRLSPNIVRPVE